jgi:uncharacterized membrane protein YbaN (DUF454 family)
MSTNLLKKYFFIFLGTISLVLGFIGLFLPIIPTTPFLLLTSFCYLRGSKRLHHWLINHKIFGEYIYNYITYGGVKLNVKIGSIIFLWLSLSISIFVVNIFLMRLGLLVIGIAVSFHIVSLKTISKTAKL